MEWELGALKILARNERVPGVALRDAIEEIERLKSMEPSLILHVKDREMTIAFLKLVENWLYKHGHEPLWFDEYKELRDRLIPDEEDLWM